MTAINIKPANTNDNKAKAYVTIQDGRMGGKFKLVEKDGKYYLNGLGSYDEKLKGKDLGNGRISTGHIDHVWITDKDFIQEIIDQAKKELGIE